MATFAKDFLYTGRWRLPDGRVEDFTPQRVAHLKARMKDMLDYGLPVPLAWEHQPTAQPLTKEALALAMADRTKAICGHAKSVSDGPGGFGGEVEVPDADDAKKVEAIRFVSPQIEEDVVDGLGRLWPGESIVHLAVTGRPVQHTQRPFKPVGLSLKLPICLSLDGFQGKKAMKKHDDDSPPETEETQPAETPPEPPIDDVEHPDTARLKETIEALKADSYAFPDDTDPTNFLERLHTAVLTKQMATGNTPPAGNDTVPTTTQAVNPPAGEATPPLAMSQMAAELKAHKERALKAGKKEIAADIKALWHDGRIDKTIHDNLLAEFNKAPISMSANGEVIALSVTAKIEAYKALPKGSAWAGAGNRKTEPREGSPPYEDQEEMRKEAKERAAAMSRK